MPSATTGRTTRLAEPRQDHSRVGRKHMTPEALLMLAAFAMSIALRPSRGADDKARQRAITACMRKLPVIHNAMPRSGTSWRAAPTA